MSKANYMIKAIISDLKKLKQWAKQYLFYRKHALRLKLAIKLADMKQKAFNKQYFVVLSSNNKLISLNEAEVNTLKKTKTYGPKSMKRIASNIKKKESEVIAKLEYELAHCSDPEERRELNAAIIDIKQSNKNLILRLSRLTVLPKTMDGLRIRRTAFYYTKYSANNSMTPQQRLEARERYMLYAKKFLA
jgi:hypothetical protein